MNYLRFKTRFTLDSISKDKLYIKFKISKTYSSYNCFINEPDIMRIVINGNTLLNENIKFDTSDSLPFNYSKYHASNIILSIDNNNSITCFIKNKPNNITSYGDYNIADSAYLSSFSNNNNAIPYNDVNISELLTFKSINNSYNYSDNNMFIKDVFNAKSTENSTIKSSIEFEYGRLGSLAHLANYQLSELDNKQLHILNLQ